MPDNRKLLPGKNPTWRTTINRAGAQQVAVYIRSSFPDKNYSPFNNHTMHLFSFHQHTGPKPGINDDGLIPALHEREHNTNEGSEFLDDVIRMDDEPATDQENSGNAGNRQG